MIPGTIPEPARVGGERKVQKDPRTDYSESTRQRQHPIADNLGDHKQTHELPGECPILNVVPLFRAKDILGARRPFVRSALLAVTVRRV
jgi:hypothetical protein